MASCEFHCPVFDRCIGHASQAFSDATLKEIVVAREIYNWSQFYASQTESILLFGTYTNEKPRYPFVYLQFQRNKLESSRLVFVKWGYFHLQFPWNQSWVLGETLGFNELEYMHRPAIGLYSFLSWKRRNMFGTPWKEKFWRVLLPNTSVFTQLGQEDHTLLQHCNILKVSETWALIQYHFSFAAGVLNISLTRGVETEIESCCRISC